MKYQIRWLSRALQNLAEEAAYLKQHSPNAAKAFVQQIQQQTAFLSEHPHLGRPGRVASTRELVMLNFPYVIPYRVKNGYIEILRVFHTARKYPPT